MSSLGTRCLQAAAGLWIATLPTLAQHNEVEPNSNKAQATVPSACLSAGDTLNGLTTGNSTTAGSSLSTTVDYWRVQTCALPLGVYRHQLQLTTGGTAGHTGNLRGLNQTGTGSGGGVAGTTDSNIQNSAPTTSPPRINQWYGFGRSEEVYYRVAGTTATTANYVSTLSTSAVTPSFLGTFAAGSITITAVGQGHDTDTDMWVYDGSFNAIPGFGNDDPTGTITSPSTLTRNFASGTYYVAISNFNVANNQVAATDEGWVTGNLFDFPDIVANSSAVVSLDCTFSVTDSSGIPVQAPVSKNEPYQILWVRFEVAGSGGSPFTAMCFGDGTQATPCPCANNGVLGSGCDNSIGTGGALLTAAGTVTPDTVVLTSTNEIGSVLSIFLQGNAQATGTVFGDGVRCAGGSLKRLYTKNASGGTVSAPAPGDPSITSMSSTLGDPIAPGSKRWYQVYYRDPDLTFCPTPAGSSFNVSNGIEAQW